LLHGSLSNGSFFQFERIFYFFWMGVRKAGDRCIGCQSNAVAILPLALDDRLAIGGNATRAGRLANLLCGVRVLRTVRVVGSFDWRPLWPMVLFCDICIVDGAILALLGWPRPSLPSIRHIRPLLLVLFVRPIRHVVERRRSSLPGFFWFIQFYGTTSLCLRGRVSARH